MPAVLAIRTMIKTFLQVYSIINVIRMFFNCLNFLKLPVHVKIGLFPRSFYTVITDIIAPRRGDEGFPNCIFLEKTRYNRVGNSPELCFLLGFYRVKMSFFNMLNRSFSESPPRSIRSRFHTVKHGVFIRSMA